jgi:hypothetical protein
VKRVMILSSLLVLIGACRPDPLDLARQQVHVGMSRDDAVSILAEQAWYYQPCPSRDTMDDLFFFEDHGYDKADIVIVRSTRQEGVFKVSQLGSFEPYAWQTAYADCIQRDRFQDLQPQR